mmetsp:Transcript_19273/g.24861  ORF Transcript_19273/g.24861 Transcript_19273/m.24861 type:complete len:188 (+) Transcript_19273:191-754(+)|eukprot:CAMPEP_0198144822 /NCGR_PEP_ID=MMETSP1443-20131203/18690_1 /TAXON_ID=186043 /ORGANISM="Entomoneis sp., Strain CCMP2396" /LENGTH=187 /DNA_ID=CAMNT_0043808285 /DNA_START=175 /DNA_END=738 /DNA_ORIENTATION=+
MSSAAVAPSSPAQAQERPSDPTHGPAGCYLCYEVTSGGRLMLHYSQGHVPDNAVGFWLPTGDQSIQGFKFKQAGGRSELIKGIAGGDSNRRRYFVGWCQFLKQAVAKKGRVIMFTPAQGVAVDIYGYENHTQQPRHLDMQSGLVDVTPYDAFAVVPRHAAFLKGVKSICDSNFLELGNLAGASSKVD